MIEETAQEKSVQSPGLNKQAHKNESHLKGRKRLINISKAKNIFMPTRISKLELLGSSNSEEVSSPRDATSPRTLSYPSEPNSATSVTGLLPFSTSSHSGATYSVHYSSSEDTLGSTKQQVPTEEDSKMSASSTVSFIVTPNTGSSPVPEMILGDGDLRCDTNAIATTSCATTITTNTTTTCSNGSTPARIRIIRNPRLKLSRESFLTTLVALLTVLSSIFLVLYMRAIFWRPLSDSSMRSERPVCTTPDCLRAASRILDRMDRSVSPCDDFYRFSCGNYLKTNVVPENSHYRSSMQEMQEEVLVVIKKMLDFRYQQDNESDALGKARRLFHSCINTSFTVHEKDMADSPIFTILTDEYLGEWPMLSDESHWSDDQYNLEKLMGFLNVYEVHSFFDIYILPDDKNSSIYTLQFYKGTPSLARRYFVNATNEEYVGYMAAYRALLEEVLTALNGDKSTNTTYIDELISFETKFATISDIRKCDEHILGLNNTNGEFNETFFDMEEEIEIFEKMTLEELDKMTPQIKWSEMLRQTVSKFPELNLDLNSLIINIHCSPFIPDLVDLVSETPKRVIVNYLLWRFVLKYLPYISNYFQQLWQQFESEVPDPFEEKRYATRWKECVAVVNEGFGAALASSYVMQHYDERITQEIDLMVEEVRSAFNEVIFRQEWLEFEMKRMCSEKLYLMGKKIGYPQYIKSTEELNEEFEGLDIFEDHFLNNILRMKKHEMSKQLQKLTRPVDKKDWLIQPLIVNAFHNPTANEIILPLGILREPFYNLGYPMYLNYASLGVVVGHELVHGFDNHGKKYDKHGNQSQWWSVQMAEQFMERALCFVEQYSQFPLEMTGKNVDGNETLGDNICDNTGLINAWLAYQNWVGRHGEIEPALPGLNYTIPQTFLIAFAQIWCEVVSKEGYDKYSTDMHSPGEFRTNGVAQNSDFFADTWSCPTGTTMNPSRKCRLWT